MQVHVLVIKRLVDFASVDSFRRMGQRENSKKMQIISDVVSIGKFKSTRCAVFIFSFKFFFPCDLRIYVLGVSRYTQHLGTIDRSIRSLSSEDYFRPSINSFYLGFCFRTPFNCLPPPNIPLHDVVRNVIRVILIPVTDNASLDIFRRMCRRENSKKMQIISDVV